MNIEKRGNKYRISQMVNGKMYRATIDHKPTQSEATALIAEKINASNTVTSNMPLKRACRAYIASKDNLLSSSTIRGYEGIIRAIKTDFANLPINTITKPMLQANINEYSQGRSPKTASNYGNFILSVLAYFGNEIKGIVFPQREKTTPYIPSEEDIRRILNEIRDSKYEVPLLLSLMGLRRSEICALTPSDLNGNVLTINKAKVQNERKEWVIKATKTTDSTRTIVLPDYLVSLINKKGFYNGHPELIYRALTDAQRKLGIPHFSLHKMRHFCMSYLHNLGYSDKQIQEIGGYRSNYILKTVYTHAMEMDEAKKKMADSFGSLLG